MFSRFLVPVCLSAALLAFGCGDAGSGSNSSNGGNGSGASAGSTGTSSGGTGGAGAGSIGGSSGGTGGSTGGASGGTGGTTCPGGSADCNNNAADGCETSLVSDPKNCGACGNECPSGAGLPANCIGGQCGLECAPGLGNCDGNVQNGCESDLGDDPQNCGACGMSCGGSPCVSGACACASESKNANPVPLDLFIMLDQSGSMDDPVQGGGTKWAAVTTALKGFFQDPSNAGLGVGLQYFPLDSGGGACGVFCNVDADCGAAACGPCFLGVCLGGGGGGDSCNPADYASPAVEIAPLAAGQINALNTSINQHSPTTNTPTGPALQGAINHAVAWATSHPTHKVVVVLATDGEPTECDPMDIPSIANIAAQGVNGNPSVLTFVIGVGSSLANLNAIAQGGGTGSAFLVDTGGNVVQQFQAALAAIQDSALGCEYTIPQPMNGMLDFTKVNVQYTPGNGGAPQIINNVTNAAACDPQTGGWYYDDNANPTKIILCPKQCDAVTSDPNAKLDILLGCATQHM